MKPPILQTGTNSETGTRIHKEGQATTSLSDGDQASLTDLIAIVERALDLADALGLGLVGIDLCSALERLNEIGEAANATTTRGHD